MSLPRQRDTPGYASARSPQTPSAISVRPGADQAGDAEDFPLAQVEGDVAEPVAVAQPLDRQQHRRNGACRILFGIEVAEMPADHAADDGLRRRCRKSPRCRHSGRRAGW